MERLSRRRILTCFLLAGLPMTIRLIGLPRAPIPQPVWDDEYSYLLGADTLASGRLANPPHPMWIHFETFHVNWLPTYVTKFPPAQPLVLAFGQKFLGHPWYGAWMSFGLMCAALCWMLQGWMPPVYALLGTLLGIAEVGLFRYWMDSYCGGAVPAMGGCLVIGAAIRLGRGAGWRAAALGSLGLMVLANSRPFEGLAVSAASAFLMLWLMRRSRSGLRQLLRAEVLVPFAAICGLVFCWMGYYNYRTTGSPLVAPYAVNHKMYGANPQFWLLPDWPPPVYRHDVIRKIWTVWTHDQWARARRNPLHVIPEFVRGARFFLSPLSALAILSGLLVARSRKVWMAAAIAAVLCVILLLQVSVAPHYFAPGIFVLLIPALYSIRRLKLAGGRFGPALVLLAVAVMFAAAFQPDRYHDWEDIPARSDVDRALSSATGPHLVFVRYAPDHEIVMMDRVYNRADIDASPIVWARYMGPDQDRELIGYYPNRKAWIYDADVRPLSLEPYEPSESRRPDSR
ncbi:MAG TPA: hypothetical protein VMH28_09020 [Candidatus Acidoferrales bacterium]|nr:hypothetical protein [Candidatus Acidoferrales bacterium]